MVGVSIDMLIEARLFPYLMKPYSGIEEHFFRHLPWIMTAHFIPGLSTIHDLLVFTDAVMISENRKPLSLMYTCRLVTSMAEVSFSTLLPSHGRPALITTLSNHDIAVSIVHHNGKWILDSPCNNQGKICLRMVEDQSFERSGRWNQSASLWLVITTFLGTHTVVHPRSRRTVVHAQKPQVEASGCAVSIKHRHSIRKICPFNTGCV